MARKNLLNESEIRRFMKLANMGAIGDSRVVEMSVPTPGTMDEQEFGMEDEVDVLDVEGEDELDMDLDMDVEEVPEEEGEGEMTLSDDEALAIIDLADRLRDAMGDEVEGEDELDMDLDMDMEEPVGDEEEMMVAGEEELEEPGNRALYEGKGTTKRTQEDLVNEVARRVAARLAATEKQEQMVEHLAERILKRLTD